MQRLYRMVICAAVFLHILWSSSYTKYADNFHIDQLSKQTAAQGYRVRLFQNRGSITLLHYMSYGNIIKEE